MALLNPAVQKQVRAVLAELKSPVTLAVFTRTGGDVPCETCDETRELLEELASLSNGNVRVEAYDLERDAGAARAYNVDKAPAVAVLGGDAGRRDFGIRFFGCPAGYEFGTLIEDIRMASTGVTDLSPGTIETLSRLDAPLHLQVFVTPTCPYCPRAVLLAHKMAIAGERVTAAAVDATEFPELATRYEVYGVPRTVINDTVHVEGAVPEARLMAELIAIVGERHDRVSVQ
jgi:glutaredoxin-like protein